MDAGGPAVALTDYFVPERVSLVKSLSTINISPGFPHPTPTPSDYLEKGQSFIIPNFPGRLNRETFTDMERPWSLKAKVIPEAAVFFTYHILQPKRHSNLSDIDILLLKCFYNSHRKVVSSNPQDRGWTCAMAQPAFTSKQHKVLVFPTVHAC